jgi:hypothetical protein
MNKLLNTLIFLLALIAPVISHAQSKAETETWLIEQSRENTQGLSYKMEDDQLMLILELPSLGTHGGGEVHRTVKLAEVKTVSMEHTDRYLSFKLMCETDCVYQVVNDRDGKFESEEKRKSMLFEIYRKLDKSYPPRVQKALLHLIKLNGGNAKMVVSQKPKEPF